MTTLSTILREYGQAMRGYWGALDGRAVRQDMGSLANWAETNSVPDDAREQLGLCPAGLGHWIDFCSTDCNEGDNR